MARPVAPTARRVCPDVDDSRATSRPIVPTVHRELARRGLLRPGGRNLDLGGGRYELATEFLAGEGVRNLVVDPSRGDAHNARIRGLIEARPADTVTVANVLNVICDAGVRQEVVREAAASVKPGGVVAFQVYVGDGRGVGGPTTNGWQENRKPPSYMPEIERWFEEVERAGDLFFARRPRRRPAGPIPPDAPMRACCGAPARRSNPPAGPDEVRGRARSFAFHTFGSLYGADHSEAVRGLIRRGASLAPRDERPARGAAGWPDLSGGHDGIDDIDRLAGDGSLVFFTVGRPRYNRAAVAFEVERLFAFGRVGWRSRDLARLYVVLERLGAPGSMYPRFAEAFTVWEPDGVRLACELQTRAMFDADASTRLDALSDLGKLWRRLVWNRPETVALMRRVRGLRDRHLEAEMATSLDRAEVESHRSMERGAASEVVLRGRAPLRQASDWYDEVSGGWWPVGKGP